MNTTYDEWKARQPQPYEDGPSEPTEEEQIGDYIDEMAQQGIRVSEWPFAGNWQAVRDSYEPPMPVGQGKSPRAAVADLLELEDA